MDIVYIVIVKHGKLGRLLRFYFFLAKTTTNTINYNILNKFSTAINVRSNRIFWEML